MVEVKVVRIGTQKPSRVLVRFVDAAFEGGEEWVPPNRLKTLWEYAEAFNAREARWDAVTSPGLPQDDPREEAAEIVFTELIDDELAHFGYFSQGAIVSIPDADALASFLEIDPRQLRSHENSFTEDGVLIAPWEITELVVSTAVAMIRPRSCAMSMLKSAERAARPSTVTTPGQPVDETRSC